MSAADALVALVMEGDAEVGYSCGSGTALGTHTGWFLTLVDGSDPGPVPRSDGLSSFP